MRASEQIRSAALSWSGVTAHPHRFGGTEYRLGRREIGHMHGDHLVDIPFPKSVRNELIAAGLAEPHHILPNSGWISFYIKQTTSWNQRSRCFAARTIWRLHVKVRNLQAIRKLPGTVVTSRAGRLSSLFLSGF